MVQVTYDTARPYPYQMKILLAGDWRWPIYEQAFSRALSELGQEVIPFHFKNFFAGPVGYCQSAVPLPGPALLKLNRRLLETAKSRRPDVVLVWRGTHVLPRTIARLNRAGITTVSYNNDDPFVPRRRSHTPWHQAFLWHWYLQALRYYRYNFFYRKINVTEALQAGAAHAAVLKPYFIPWRDRPVTLTAEEQERFGCDVVFVGHYEPDGRVDSLRALVEAGFSVRLFGDSTWNRSVLGKDLCGYFGKVTPANGEDYAKALCGAKVCLAFLSKHNRDTYTRRCFEIPACGRVMLAERTDDLLCMFEEGRDACFFSHGDELLIKAKWLLENPCISEAIAESGRMRVLADGHDVKSRASEFLSSVTAVTQPTTWISPGEP